MAEEIDSDPDLFDAEWVCRLLSRRIMDVMDIIDDLKGRDRSMNAKINRLKARLDGDMEEEEELEAEEEGGLPTLRPIDLHKLTVSELQELFR